MSHRGCPDAQVNLRSARASSSTPSTVPISTSAAQLSFERDGYLIEPAFDFHQRAGYLSVAKDHRSKYNLRGSYASARSAALAHVLHCAVLCTAEASVLQSMVLSSIREEAF